MSADHLPELVHLRRELLEVARSEIRANGAHWAAGLPALEHLVCHDRRMPDGGCLTCQLLALLDVALAPPERERCRICGRLIRVASATASPGAEQPVLVWEHLEQPDPDLLMHAPEPWETVATR